MFKIVATFAAATLLSVVTLATSADAGCGGGHLAFHNYAARSTPTPSRAAQLRAKKAAEARAVAAARRKSKSDVAKAEKPADAPAAKVADTAPAANDKVAAAATETMCTKFIAATGTTVEVSCSRE